MKPFLILTGLCILALAIIPELVSGNDPYGFSELVAWAVILVVYVLSLVSIGFGRTFLKFQDSLKDEPRLDHPGHRRGLVRTSQLPDFMKNDAPEIRRTNIPTVPRK